MAPSARGFKPVHKSLSVMRSLSRASWSGGPWKMCLARSPSTSSSNEQARSLASARAPVARSNRCWRSPRSPRGGWRGLPGCPARSTDRARLVAAIHPPASADACRRIGLVPSGISPARSTAHGPTANPPDRPPMSMLTRQASKLDWASRSPSRRSQSASCRGSRLDIVRAEWSVGPLRRQPLADVST